MASLVQMIQFPDKEPEAVRSQKLRALALTVQQLSQQLNSSASAQSSSGSVSANYPYLVTKGTAGLPNSSVLQVLSPITLAGGNVIGFDAALVMLEQLGDVLVSGALFGQILMWNGGDWINVDPSKLKIIWSQIQGTPTTLEGYDITDAVNQSFDIIAGPGLTGGGTMGGGSLTIGLGPQQVSPVFIPEDPEDNSYVIPGPPGAAGRAGRQGVPGAQGEDGEDGYTIPGPPGVAGTTGAAGAMGGQGYPGAQGDDGEDGYTIPGPQGPPGPTGPAGSGGSGSTVFLPQDDPEDAYVIPGTQGADGSPGATGPTGPPGQSFPGRRGEDGETGRQGARGATGLTGATGTTGSTGAKGSQGNPGRTGDEGEKGARGSTGAQGAVGGTGPTGPTGSTGIGVPGRQGDEGEVGRRGIPGPVGPVGAGGATGATGAIGPVGIGVPGRQGDEGEVGRRGIPGPVGPIGVTGATGSTGSTGFGAPGRQGDEGEVGRRGIPGPVGPTGATGSTGTIGPQGSPGRRGGDGEDGLAGRPGIPGTAGAAGSSGATGAIGQSIRGRQGEDGDAGRRGMPGLTGVTGATGSTGATGAAGQNIRGRPGDHGDDGRRGPPGLTGATGATGATGPAGSGGSGGGARRTYHDEPSERAMRGAMIASAPPTATVQLTAVTGHSGQFMDAASAPALNTAISPTWYGNHTFAPASGIAQTINASAAHTAISIIGASGYEASIYYTDGGTGNRQYGLGVGIVAVGAFSLYDITAGKERIRTSSIGTVTILAPDSGTALVAKANSSAQGIDLWTGVVNGGVLLQGFNSTGATRTGYVYFISGTSGIGGATETIIDNDGTTANDYLSFVSGGVRRLQINGVGNVTIPAAASGVSLTVTGNATAIAGLQVVSGANQWGGQFLGNSTSGQSYGMFIQAGTTSADISLGVYKQTLAKAFYLIRGDGQISWPQAGTGTCTLVSGVLTITSDERIKTNIRPFARGLAEILALKPILHGYTIESGLDQTRDDYAGFSAQNVQRVIPEAVGRNRDGMLSLSDRGILAALVNAVKELAEFVKSPTVAAIPLPPDPNPPAVPRVLAPVKTPSAA
jgi:hypothetical protein